MNSENVKDILTRYHADHCTEAERHLVESWILHGNTDPLDFSDAQLLEDLLDIRLHLERDFQAEKTTKIYPVRKWLRYTAILVFILSTGLWLFRNQWLNQERADTKDQIADIAPGGNKAILMLADGRTINLSEAQAGIVVGDGITYADGSTLLSGEDAPSQIQQLTTPKGGTYQVTLPEGTKVWLNSASTLTYPNRFADDERVVEIAGEAYFEVAKNHQKPFKVISKDQQLTVLGTAFNISAYSDETEVKTTLVEGSVRVTSAASYPDAVLTVGQQSILSSAGITVDDVEVAPFIGWKDGYFLFNGTELRDAMKQLSRWYDVDVVYEGNIPKTPFFGKISRNDTLAEVLEILKEGKVNFRIEKQADTNRLIVMPDDNESIFY